MTTPHSKLVEHQQRCGEGLFFRQLLTTEASEKKGFYGVFHLSWEGVSWCAVLLSHALH